MDDRSIELLLDAEVVIIVKPQNPNPKTTNPGKPDRHSDSPRREASVDAKLVTRDVR
jgi:hypothetical protein